jgi:hypothetical protein
MKWKTKKKPKNNDERERVIFAVLPRKCEDGYTRWLQYVKISERFTSFYSEGGMHSYEGWDEYAVEGL